MSTKLNHPVFKLLLLAAFVVGMGNSATAQEEAKEKVRPKLRMSYTKPMDGQTEAMARGYYKLE
ncbi:MAG: hypothetical protein K9J06_13615, partial [Flavobacteriales bacterium]|nr:hypothetical protein [Flavobacteriales bacterium]